MTSKDKTLMFVIEHEGLRELPAEWDGKRGFSSAIYLITKSNGNQYYVIGKRDAFGQDNITLDQGPVAFIVSIDKIYPYVYNSENQIASGIITRNDKIKFLVGNGYGTYDEVKKLTQTEINKAVNKLIEDKKK